jgi:alpha-L-arabinofuranosidase
MASRNYQPLLVKSAVTGAAAANLDVSAKRSEDGKTLVLQIVNTNERAVTASLTLNGFTPRKATARVEELAGPLDARNTAAAPERIRPALSDWKHNAGSGHASRAFPAHSFTVVRFE